ncbi:MAG TPA: hypothetical protein VEV44_15715 [Pseudoneobacillus sp.]|nr:hypothetical protein [Pseudoneobacillus sp.]
MIENQNSKDKLISMLTEIYGQLEELESVLDSSLVDLRSNMQQHQLDQVDKNEEKIIRFEKAMSEQSFASKEHNETYQNIPSALKLELGF